MFMMPLKKNLGHVVENLEPCVWLNDQLNSSVKLYLLAEALSELWVGCQYIWRDTRMNALFVNGNMLVHRNWVKMDS